MAKPFMLTWDGIKYVPSFKPEFIEVTAYHKKDYLELQDQFDTEYAYSDDLKIELAQQDKLIHYLVEERVERMLALSHLESAKRYLEKSSSDWSMAWMILDTAQSEVLQELLDRERINTQYENLQPDGTINDPSIKQEEYNGHCSLGVSPYGTSTW